jgi:acetyl esterase/lipase
MSVQNQLLTWALRRWIKPNSLRSQDIATARARAARVPFPAKLPRGWQIRAEHGTALRGEWIEPAAPTHVGCILYFHGGAYATMSARTHRSITSRLAAWSNTRLFALDYRLAPEHPFPAALEDALAAYRALIAAGALPSQIAIVGDSAGGGLALALLVALRNAKDPPPAAAVLFSPWTDLAVTGESIIDNDGTDALFFGSWVATQAQLYLADTPATNSLASPVYADLTGLPPLLIQVSDSEVLLDDSRRVYENARRVGVAATLQVWPGLPHDWQIFAPILPEARAALRSASAFVREKLASMARSGAMEGHSVLDLRSRPLGPSV